MLLQAVQLSRSFRASGTVIQAVSDVQLEMQAGEFCLIQGPSGGGKTTLLAMLGGMLRPSSGQVLWKGVDPYNLSSKRRAALRRSSIGFVFQSMHLLPYLNVVENVALPQADRKLDDQSRNRLQALGLESRLRHRPGQLSAGERQRVALARALAMEPELLLADEPTGNLDPESAALVAQCLEEYRQNGGAVVLVSHHRRDEWKATRRASLEQGRLLFLDR